MNWFNKHLNWTWVLAYALQFNTLGFETPIPFYSYLISIYFYICFLGITLWVISRKGRRWLWVLIPISAPFLRNKRKSSKKELKAFFEG